MSYFYSTLGVLIFLIGIGNARSQEISYCRITLTGGTNVVCQGQTLVLIAEEDVSFGRPVSRTWSIGGQDLDGRNLPFFRFDTSVPGTFPVSFRMQNEDGFESTCEVVVKVLPLPEIQIVKTYPFLRNILRNRSRPRLAINISEDYLVQWFLNGDELKGATRPVLHVKSPGKYRVRVTCPQGCLAVGEVLVTE
jgi:hypothetical protein